MTEPYPRDLVGYGEHPPHAAWPGNARVAVQFVINHEEGGENNILHGDAASEAFLSEIVGAQPWPGQRHMNMESIYEYGTRAGFWRLHRMFTARNMPVTVYAVATALQRYPAIVGAMQRAGWEIATHGYKWIDYKDYTLEAERAHVLEAVRLHTQLTGERPLGFYQGRASIHSSGIAAEEGGFLYLADSYADDLPYWTDGPHGPQLVVPYTLDANDMRFATPQGFNAGDQFFSYLKDTFDLLYQEGDDRPKMMSVGLHSRLVGRPGRAAALARFLEYVMAHERVWVARRVDIARHWIATHPPPGGYRPSRMASGLFLARFGDVFEHRPEIAALVHAAGLSEADDTADALHARMVAAMRALDESEKLALIRAHPDLAGRLSRRGELTTDSAREQASAGLDQLSAADYDRFTALNTAYVGRFGFPFIIAVRGRDPRDILAAFEARLGNTTEYERETALAEIEHIALFRISDRMTA